MPVLHVAFLISPARAGTGFLRLKSKHFAASDAEPRLKKGIAIREKKTVDPRQKSNHGFSFES